MSIAGKLALWLVAGTGVIFTAFSVLHLRVQRRGLERMALEAGGRMGDVIVRGARYQMLHNNREALRQMVIDIGGEPGIAGVRILDGEGRASFATGGGTHAPGLTVQREIVNEPSCWQAACHAHGRDQRVLGVVEARLKLDEVEAESEAQRALLIRVSLAAVGAVSLLSTGFVWMFVHRPIRELRAGTQRVASGDLSYRLQKTSRDELGDLVESFNAMTDRLEQSSESRTRQLEKAQTFLEGSERMVSIGKLAATVAHEVNNPLFGILTYARLGLKALEGEPARKERAVESLRVIERESRRCGEIMRNLLTFARQAPSRRSAQDLNELVDRAVTLVKHQFELQGIGLEQSADPALPAVACDPGQVQQVILALLINAAEAMGGGGTVHVETRRESGAARIAVRDNGPGIAPGARDRIFDPFFTTKDDVHRTGMGLTVARTIVEQHGGAIEVRSEQGAGAEFTVRLPLNAEGVA